MAVRELGQQAFQSRADAIFGGLPDGAQQVSGTADGAIPLTGISPQCSQTPSWELSKEPVYRSGRPDAYSSDEEEAAQAEEDHRQDVLTGGLARFKGARRLSDMLLPTHARHEFTKSGADSEVQDVIKPSGPFCNALDREDEFDHADATAMLAGLPDRSIKEVSVLQHSCV